MAQVTQQAPASNYAATAAPTVNDDDTLGYEVGSRWADSTNFAVYVCTDATTGAAVWVPVLAANDAQHILAGQIFGG